MKSKLYVYFTILTAIFFHISCKKHIPEPNISSTFEKNAVARTLTSKEPNIIAVLTGTIRLGRTSGGGSDILYIYSKDISRLQTSKVIKVTFSAGTTIRIPAKILWAAAENVAVEIPCGAQTGVIEVQELGAYNMDGSANVFIHKTELFTITDPDPYIDAVDAYKPANKAIPGSTITIYGKHFGTDISKINVVFPGNIPAKTITAECGSIIVEVPRSNPLGPISGAITITVAGKPTATGPTFTFANPPVNPYTTFFLSTWPNKYDGTPVSEVNIRALCVDEQTETVYAWDIGNVLGKDGRILEYKLGTAGFVNLANTSTFFWGSVSDMDADVSDNKLYVSEFGSGVLWSVDLKKVKTDPGSAFTATPGSNIYNRKSIKFFPRTPADGLWRAYLFTQEASATTTPELRYTSFAGPATYGINQKFWYNTNDILSPSGLDILVNPSGGYNVYVTDISTGRVLAGASGADKNDLGVFAAGLIAPKDIAISDKTTGTTSIICIACRDGIRIYDKSGNYKYTLQLKNPSDGKIYAPDFVAVGKTSKYIYAGSNKAKGLFIFYTL